MYELKTVIAAINKLNIFEKGKLFMFRFSQQYHFFSSTTSTEETRGKEGIFRKVTRKGI